MVDSIAFGSVPNASVAVIDPGFTPENLSRNPANLTPNASAAWFSGRLDSANGDASLAYTASFSGTYRSGASPGRLNHAGTPTASASVLLNEIHINPPGVDDDEEFIEIRSTSGGSVSTNGYTLLLVDGDGTNTGPLIRAWSLDGLATGSNGLLLLGSGYAAGNVPWVGATAPAAGTSIASLPGLTPGLLGAINSNGTTNLLLVRYFYGREGDDLDTPNNGTMDVQLWSRVAGCGRFPRLGQHAASTCGGGARLWRCESRADGFQSGYLCTLSGCEHALSLLLLGMVAMFPAPILPPSPTTRRAPFLLCLLLAKSPPGSPISRSLRSLQTMEVLVKPRHSLWRHF